jgi:hypothetical protein
VKDFCCHRCGRWGATAWPSGIPLVSLRLERVYHVERKDGSRTSEPAGCFTRVVCVVCGDALWNRTREVLDGGAAR